MKDKNLTYQLNPLLEAQKDFDVMETRLFYLGLRDVNPHISVNDKHYDKVFPNTVITPQELTKIFGHSQYLTEVDRASKKLIGRYIAIKYADGFDYYTIFQHIKYKAGKGLFIKFNEDMRRFILDIYKSYKEYGFTKIDMQQIFVLGSTYGMRILELLLQYRGKAKNRIIEREFEIDELRYKLNVPDGAYKGKICNFKQFVLDYPIKDINKNTQYNVSYETIKTGRKVTGFKFYCNCNKAIKDEEYTETIESQSYEKKLEQEAGQMQLLESQPAQAQQGLTEEQQAVYDRLVIRGITKKKAENLVKAYDIKRIKQNMEVAVKMKDNAKNLPGREMQKQKRKKQKQEKKEKEKNAVKPTMISTAQRLYKLVKLRKQKKNEKRKNLS